MTELLGKQITYEVANGEVRKGTIIGYEHHVGLNKELFNCVSPYGNRFRLSRSEFKLVEEGDSGWGDSYLPTTEEVKVYRGGGMNTCMMCLENMTYDEICERCDEVVEAGMKAIHFKRCSERGQDMDGDIIDLEKLKIGSDLL